MFLGLFGEDPAERRDRLRKLVAEFGKNCSTLLY